jgi:phosphate transport system substrate-binding protein
MVILRIKMRKFIALYGLFLLVSAQPALAREQIRVVGSATVYPFTTAAAEQFGQGGKFKTPIVESTGTGGGFKLFCEGIGENTPDISNASRQITDSEKQLCIKNGVSNVWEIQLGYDGIVLASKKGTPLLDLSKKTIFMALARELPDKNGKLIKNPYKTWREIDPALPDNPIEVYGPPPTSGTRDAFVELVMEKGCTQIAEFVTIYPDPNVRKKYCSLLREDGKFIEDGDDNNVVVQKLFANEKALGITTYSFVEENIGKVQPSKIEGIAPNFANIETGKYSISRGLYIYVKQEHIGKIAGLKEFILEITSENAIGDDGYVVERGLLPLTTTKRESMRNNIKNKLEIIGK